MTLRVASNKSSIWRATWARPFLRCVIGFSQKTKLSSSVVSLCHTLINHRRSGKFLSRIEKMYSHHYLCEQYLPLKAMEDPSHERQETKRLLKQCRIITDDRWPVEIPLLFDGRGVEGNEADKAALEFFDALTVWGKARDLTIKNVALSVKPKDRFESVLDANLNLEKLSLVNISTHEGGMHFLSRSFFSANKQVREFTLDKCKLQSKDTFFLQRLLGVGSLNVLNLRNMNVDDTIPRIFPRIAHSTTLEKLDLSGCRMRQDVLVELFRALSMNKSLKSVALQNCGINTTLSQELDNVLLNHASLETLDLCSNSIRGETVALLAKSGLLKNRSLRRLVLANNPIGDNGAKALVELLISNPTIQYLSLVDCEIWGPGCHSLSTGLAQMKGLKELLVDGEMEDYANEVLQSLECNMTLRYLWTDRTAYLFHKDRTWRLVEFFLRLNRGKRRMLVEPGVPISIWPRVLEGISGNPQITYHILRQKPEIIAYNKGWPTGC